MAVLATEIEVRGTDGVWRTLNVMDALRALQNRKGVLMRCCLCKGQAVPMDTSKDGKVQAHVEHRTRWAGCPRSDVYDNKGLRNHRMMVAD